MALTPEQIAAQINDIGENIPQALFRSIETAANIAIEEIKANMPYDTGALKNSLKARIVDDQFLGITMLDYGWFQNFGVEGTKSSGTVLGVSEIVKEFLPPRNGDKYSFNKDKRMIGGDLPFGVRTSIHQKGITGKGFIDMEQLTDRVVELVNENLEL